MVEGSPPLDVLEPAGSRVRVDDDALPGDAPQNRLDPALLEPVRDSDRADSIAAATDTEYQRTARFRDATCERQQG
jgi:hypothetical protein